MFETELQMQKEFIRLLNLNKKKNQNILEEFNARFGNVDVVMTDYNNLKITMTKPQAEILSNYSTALVVAFLHRKKAHTFKYLIDRYTEEYLLSILSTLKRENIVLEENNKFIICDDFKFPNLKLLHMN